MKLKNYFLIIPLLLIIVSCSISYGFTGTSIDYTKVRTMTIKDFPNRAALVYPPLALNFNSYLNNFFTRNTKLIFIENGGDLELEGEITRYDLTPLSVQDSKEAGGLLATLTRLTMSVKIRFTDNTNPSFDKEETITAYRDFDSGKGLDEVQEQLDSELIEEIVDQIFNTTLSNW